MNATTTYAAPTEAGREQLAYSTDPEYLAPCRYCGSPVIQNYDGRGTGWSHYFGDARDGNKACEAPAYRLGTRVVTTVYSIGGRSEEVRGTVTEVKYSRRYPERVATYVVATESGHGLICVPADDAERVSA